MYLKENFPLWVEKVKEGFRAFWRFILWTQGISIADDPNFQQDENNEGGENQLHWRPLDDDYWIF